MRLMPKITSPVNAVHLRQEVLAEKGQWLLIFPDDTVRVMDDAEVRATFDVGPTPRRGRPAKISRGSVVINLDGKLTTFPAQLGRVLAAADLVTRQPNVANFTTHTLRQHLDWSDVRHASARLSEALKRGLVVRIDDGAGPGMPGSWALSNDGRAIARAIVAGDLP